ncbi:UPF0481 protein At3g47200-like [Tasmannia lanceolata]|uniref:UPF0481 protein At3g47200-like n=1 Tax=Tasmannia lanceolata TaxID=3420 RepID=UPI00406447EF
MEEYKHRALHHRIEVSKKPIDDYKKMLDDVVQDVMDSYEQLDDEWRHQDKFLHLMLLDGFFLLELLRSYCWINNYYDVNDPVFSLLQSVGIENDYGINDPVFSFDGSVSILPYIVSDLLMVENQLPLLVLQRIIAVEWHSMEREECMIFGPPANTRIGEGIHIVDIVRKRMIFAPPTNTSSHLSSVVMPSFSDLFDVGVKLRQSETESIRDITFSDGILSLPVFIVEGGTKSFLLNVIAFEQLHNGAGPEVSSFIAFMYGLMGNNVNRLRPKIAFQ